MVFARLINIFDRYRLFEWGVVYIILSLGFLLGLVLRPEHNSELLRKVYGNHNIIALVNLNKYFNLFGCPSQ